MTSSLAFITCHVRPTTLHRAAMLCSQYLRSGWSARGPSRSRSLRARPFRRRGSCSFRCRARLLLVRSLPLASGAVVSAPGATTEDRFAADDLVAALTGSGHRGCP